MGRETTAGTAVAASSLWRGIGAIKDNREVTYVEEDVGVISGLDRNYIAKIDGQLSFEETPATFEQILHVFEAGIKTVGTGVVDTGGSGKVYAYPFATTATPTIKTYTIEGGDNQQAEEMEYAFVEEFTLSGEGGGPLNLSAEWRGRQVQNATFTGSIAIPTVEDILFTKGKLYIDAVGGTIGSTLKSNLLIAANVNVKTGIIPKFFADGNLYFSIHQFTMPEITVEVTYEHDANAVAQKAIYRAGTPQLYRLEWTGAALTTAGTFNFKTLRFDFAGTYEDWSALDDRDGNSIVTASLRARYNATAARFAEFKVVNQLASVP
jgi:hypothetical protein